MSVKSAKIGVVEEGCRKLAKNTRMEVTNRQDMLQRLPGEHQRRPTESASHHIIPAQFRELGAEMGAAFDAVYKCERTCCL